MAIRATYKYMVIKKLKKPGSNLPHFKDGYKIYLDCDSVFWRAR